MTTPTPEQLALQEFERIRYALLVPFKLDLAGLQPPELPEDRRWLGNCLAYKKSDDVVTKVFKHITGDDDREQTR